MEFSRSSRRLLALAIALPPLDAKLARYWRVEAWRDDLAEIGDATLAERLELSAAERQSLGESNSNTAVEAALRELVSCGGHLVTIADPGYPALLREISAPPWVLFVRGSLEAREPAVAIVGSRGATAYGTRAAAEIAAGLAAAGITVVSGMARGIDAAAHQAALDAGGRTLAVLGCGLDVAYPAGHDGLREAVAAQGALVTEFPCRTPPRAQNFPRRNRILAGLALGTVVVEAAERSGSLITARFALEQNREVFSVPGSIFQAQARGTHALIQGGAKLTACARDILEEMPQLFRNIAGVASPPLATLSAGLAEDERVLLAGLSDTEPVTVDALASRASWSAPRCLAALLTLEMKGIIKALPGAAYLRIK